MNQKIKTQRGPTNFIPQHLGMEIRVPDWVGPDSDIYPVLILYPAEPEPWAVLLEPNGHCCLTIRYQGPLSDVLGNYEQDWIWV